jgi:SNF2 family DNA or RNA helicase
MTVKIVDNKALLVTTDDTDIITACIPKSRKVDDGLVLVRWGFDECRILTNLGIKEVPNTILKDYIWTGVYTPYNHQKVTASFLASHRRAYCLNEMGTGKTMAAAWAADYLMNIGEVSRVLVVCPLSIAYAAWQSDLFRCVMHRSIAVAHGEKARRGKIISEGAEFIIINYDGLESVTKYIANGGFDLVILDEATEIKNVKTRRWKTLNQLITKDCRLWQMTGTPTAQSPMDAYGLLKLMNPKTVDKTEVFFKDRVMNKVDMFRWIPKPESNDIIHSLMQPAIRFTKEDCLDLPERTYITRDVPLTKQQEKFYEKIKDKMIAEVGDDNLTAMNAAVQINKLLQIASGAAYLESGDVVEFDVSNRYKELVSIIHESSHSVLVFCTFRNSINMLHTKLTQDGFKVGEISGEIGLTQRSETVRLFQESKEKQVLIIQPKAAAHGLTLHAANTVVWWSPTTSYGTYAQANDRVHRSGQVNVCTVVHLQGCEVEKKLYKALQSKEKQQINLLAMYKSLRG